LTGLTLGGRSRYGGRGWNNSLKTSDLEPVNQFEKEHQYLNMATSQLEGRGEGHWNHVGEEQQVWWQRLEQ
jgi:hypothetical protein